MMYYMVEFDPRPGVNRAQITEAYRKFVNHFQKTFPEVKFAGFFARDILLGSRPNILPCGRYQTTPHWTRGLGRQGRAQVQQCAERPWHKLGCQDGVQN